MMFSGNKTRLLWPNIIIYFLRLHILILVSLKSSNKMKSSLIYYSAISIFSFFLVRDLKKREIWNQISSPWIWKGEIISPQRPILRYPSHPTGDNAGIADPWYNPDQVFEDRYYIHDYRRSQIFVFDREGRFQFALNEKGDGPGQYLNLSDFAIDTVRRNLVVLCAVSNALFFYDLGVNSSRKRDFRILLEPTILSSSKTRIRSLSSPMIMTIAWSSIPYQEMR